MRVLRSVVVRIVLVMTFGFNLNLNISVGRDKASAEGVRVSDQAKQLAEKVNKREDDQRIKDRLQLHKAEVLRAKGYAFWNQFASVFREEVAVYNKHLNNDEHRIKFDDTSELYKINLSCASGGEAECAVHIDAQIIGVRFENRRQSRRRGKEYGLTVDEQDNIEIRNQAGGGGGVVSEAAVAVDVLEFFADS